MRRLLVAAGAATAITFGTVTIAGCGSTAAPILDNAELSAATVLMQSVKKVDEVTSYAADIVVDIKAPGGDRGNVQGTMRYQKNPQVAMDLTLDQVSFAGQNLPGGMRMILLDDTAYVKMEMLQTLAGAAKPWVKLDLKQMGASGGVDVDQILGQLQQTDLKTSISMLTASQDVKPVGAEQVGGVETTHYSGTFPVDEALKQLPEEARQRMQGQVPQEVKNMKFDAWIDGDGLPRKIQVSGKEKETEFAATSMFKSFNEPVAVEAPPADQVSETPRLSAVTGG